MMEKTMPLKSSKKNDHSALGTPELNTNLDLFSPEWYLENNPDVAGAGLNPLTHFLSHGASEGRDPHALFDTSWYLENNPDVAEAGLNPLTHFLSHGASEGRDPHPLFDTSWYLENNPDVAEAGLNPLTHFLSHGAAEGRDPHPLFDTSWYLENNSDVAEAGLNPLIHYLEQGVLQGRSPNPLFETTWYLEKYSESIQNSGLDPLLHYLSEEGRSIGTNPNRYFDRNWYLEKYNDVSQNYIDPLFHYIKLGAAQRRDPSPRFQTAYYAAKNGDVTTAGINPLEHFLQSGEAEGREPLDTYEHGGATSSNLSSYSAWFAQNKISTSRKCLQQRLSENFSVKPKISLIVPVYIVTPTVFKELISSVLAQTYPNWELCIAVAYFDDKELLKVIDLASKADNRIKVLHLEANRGISHNSNDALALVTGSFVALLDHDDTLPADALYEMASAIEQEEGDLFYSDKDAITESGSEHFNPLFKPSWSPEMMLSANYLTHFNVIRRSILDKIGGWDSKTDGAQDWDIFLRAAAAGAKICHVPKILYHWRHVHTSVATRGLEAKPYAANGQLITIKRWLESQGWLDAEPYFTSSQHIKINWGDKWYPTIAILLFGDVDNSVLWRKRLDSSKLGSFTELKYIGNNLQNLTSSIQSTEAEIVVIAPSSMSIMSAEWLRELIGPLQNNDIAAVSGKVLDQTGHILDAGWVSVDSKWKAIFRGSPANTYSVLGSADWFRNYSTVSLNGTAFRRKKLLSAGGLVSGNRPDLNLGLKLVENGKHRIVYNPFAVSVLEAQYSFEQELSRQKSYSNSSNNMNSTLVKDPYFNINLTLDNQGSPIIKQPKTNQRPSSHDYEAEAAYFGSNLDLSNHKTDIPNIQATPNQQTRIGWIVPDFNMPFYGGLMTILRCAEYFRQKGIRPVFIGHGSDNASTLREAIKLAFPELAAEADIYVVKANEDINSIGIGQLDAAFCTLWTTAYEPLFYPAGTTSSLVEATYRFGFFGVCNTEPLKTLYEEFGSKAEFFTPSVDTKIFNTKNRTEKNTNDSVTIFSYARPGHPRNCFELIGPALAELKKRFKDSIYIYTAGADWSPSDYGLSGSVEHLGIMQYEATADLYRACDPSYLPFELMSTGAVVCTNFNRYTGWLLKNEENCLQFELTKSSIVDTLSIAIQNPELRKQLSIKGLSTIKDSYSNWDKSFEKLYKIILKQI
jgi:O-antigen biosynthesis protein